MRVNSLLWRVATSQDNYTATASVSLTAVGGVGASFSGYFSAHKTTVKQSVGSSVGSTDFVVHGVCGDVAVTDFGGVEGVTCDDEAVTCDKAQLGTDPRHGRPIHAAEACCKCGGGVTPEDYSIGGRCQFDYDVTGTYELTNQVRVAPNWSKLRLGSRSAHSSVALPINAQLPCSCQQS